MAWFKNLKILSLLGILLIGLSVRLINLNRDEGHFFNPSEQNITIIAQDLAFPPLVETSKIFSLQSPLNPYWNAKYNQPRIYSFGSLPIYVLKTVETLSRPILGLFSPDFSSPNNQKALFYISKTLAALISTLTAFVIFLIAKRFLSWPYQLLAPVLYLFTPFILSWGSFYTPDIYATLSISIALLFSLKMVEDFSFSSAFGLGAALGLLLSSTPHMYIYCIAIFIAPFFLKKNWCHYWSRVFVACISLFLVYVILNPYSLTPFSHFLAGIKEFINLNNGLSENIATRFYRKTGLFFFLESLTLWGFGPAIIFSSLLGGGLFAWKTIKKKLNLKEIIFSIWILIIIFSILSPMVKQLRVSLPFAIITSILGVIWLESFNSKFKHVFIITLVMGTLLGAYPVFTILSERPTSIEASEWIYQNIPKGTSVAIESDEAPFPINIHKNSQGYDAGLLNLKMLPIAESDNPNKLEIFSRILSQSDYLIISSEKNTSWIEKHNLAIPMTYQTYKLLFNDKLGFHLLKKFEITPRFFNQDLDDSNTDLDWTMYTHPKIYIFKKSAENSELAYKGFLKQYMPKTELSYLFSKDKSLLLETPLSELPANNYKPTEWLKGESLKSVLIWWLIAWLLGLIVFPIVLKLFTHIDDRGYIASRLIGLLVLAYINWLGGNFQLWKNTSDNLWIIAGVLIFISSFATFFRGKGPKPIALNLKTILTFEAVTSIAFFGFCIIRALNPDLWQPWNGGEKSMELTFLNASLNTPYFPPYDPYFAHGTINYYYYGLYLVSTLIKLTGVQVEIGYNIGIAYLFSISSGLLWSLGYSFEKNPKRKWLTALCAMGFAILIGNLDSLVQLKDIWLKMDHFYFDYWRPSRVIPFTINEFPFWSYLFADLHPHLIDMSVTLLITLFSYQIFSSKEKGIAPSWIQILFLCFLIGTTAVTNTWDTPAFWGLSVGLLALTTLKNVEDFWYRILFLASTLIISILFYLPYFLAFKALYTGVALNTMHSSFVDLFKISGFFFFTIFVFLVLEGKRLFTLKSDYIFPAWLLFWGLAIIVGTELIHIKDFMGDGEWQRMNTLFKFGMQSWILLGSGCGLVFVYLYYKLLEKPMWLKLPIVAVGSFLLFSTMIFWIFGVSARINDRFPPHLGAQNPRWTLDGSAFAKTAGFTCCESHIPIEMKYDLETINWLKDNIKGYPVIAEAAIGYYREWGYRLGTYTGLPILAGMHQGEQRYGEMVGYREQLNREIYTNEKTDKTLEILRELKVKYIYFGQLEQILYKTKSFEKFENMEDLGLLKTVYKNKKSTLWEVL